VNTAQNTFVKITTAVLVLVGLHGCKGDPTPQPKVGPDTIVTVEITGVKNDVHENIKMKLKGMTDAGAPPMIPNASVVGDKFTVELFPVSDVQAFSKKIDFGRVVEVKERTVKVEFEK